MTYLFICFFTQPAFVQLRLSMGWPGQVMEKETHKNQPWPVILGGAVGVTNKFLCDRTGRGSFPGLSHTPLPRRSWSTWLPGSPWPFPSSRYLSLILQILAPEQDDLEGRPKCLPNSKKHIHNGEGQ